MKKKIFIFFFLFLVFLCFFLLLYFKDKEIRELNKNLPQGVYFEKRGKDLFLINKLDGYELKIPESWGGVREVRYVEGELSFQAKFTDDWVAVNKIILQDQKITIDEFVTQKIKALKEGKEVKGKHFSPFAKIEGKEVLNGKKIIKMVDKDPIIGECFVYYLKQKNLIYEIYSDFSENSVRLIIFNFRLLHES